jgi:hypothetical protein
MDKKLQKTTENEEVLTLTSRTNKGNFFESEKGVYWLRNADREFKGVKNKPLYYLSKKNGKELNFISGFFPTREETIFSYDVKNNVGMKQFMCAEFRDNGNQIILSAK